MRQPLGLPVRGKVIRALFLRENILFFEGATHPGPHRAAEKAGCPQTATSEPVEDQMPVSLVATRFLSCHRVEEVQVGNSHPHGKTRTHMGKLAPTWENLHPQVGKLAATSLVATRFHLVGEVQVENSHPHGKRCRNGCVNCKSRGYGRGFGSALVAPVDMPPSTSSVWPLM